MTGRSPESTQPRATCSNHNTSNKGRSPNRKIIQRNVKQPWLRAGTGRSPKSKIILRSVQQPWLRAKTGRSPKGNTAQGNTLGVSSLTNWRAVSATGTSEILVRSFLLLFQSASLLESLYPGRCPGLYSYWAFSPSLLAASTVVRCHGYTPYWAFSPSLLSASTGVRYHSYASVGLSARLCSQHQLVNSVLGYALLPLLGVNIALLIYIC